MKVWDYKVYCVHTGPNMFGHLDVLGPFPKKEAKALVKQLNGAYKHAWMERVTV